MTKTMTVRVYLNTGQVIRLRVTKFNWTHSGGKIQKLTWATTYLPWRRRLLFIDTSAVIAVVGYGSTK